jgi:hypothetical protein
VADLVLIRIFYSKFPRCDGIIAHSIITAEYIRLCY